MPLLLLVSVLIAGAAQSAVGTMPPNGVTLHADAGLGGFVRSGRWTPVRVRIDSRHHDLLGAILVEWGETRVRRAIDIPARSLWDIELYVRTSDVRGSIAVRLLTEGQVVTSVDVPVRVIADEELLVVCASAEAPEPGTAPCTTAIAPDALPRSMRGYAGADDVRLPPGAESRLTPAQRSALRRWRAAHEGESGGFTRPPQAPLTASSPVGVGRSTAFAASMVIAAAVGLAGLWMRARGPAWHSYAALAATTGLGVLAAVLPGRFGPGAEILVRHSTTMEQVGDGATLSLRGTIEYPVFDTYSLRVAGMDGEVMLRPIGASERWLDVDGTPTWRGTFGRGRHEQVEIEGVVEYAPFRVDRKGDVVRVSNVSDDVLSDCSFPEGFSEGRIGTLSPGQTVIARATAVTESAFFSCGVAPAPLTFSESRFAVKLQGAAVASVRLPAARGAASE